jgi:alkylation response protein AidB-like acyl-CoA dehydrogenase
MTMSETDTSLGEAEQVRAEVSAWLKEHWNPARSSDPSWLQEVVADGWAVPRWPREWFGRQLPDHLAAVVEEEFSAAGAHGTGQDRMNMHANTVLVFGDDAIRERFIGPMLRGEFHMCLLYSEPEAGSDLASLQTRATRQGDNWVISGQKVWTSGAAEADFGFLLARTDWEVPKHEGITFFILPMKQPGVDVRPIRQITGEAEFNEVFLNDAVVPDAYRLGAENGGWRVLQDALVFERVVMGDRSRTSRDNDAMAITQYSGDDDLVGFAAARGQLDDPVIRDQLAGLIALRLVNKWNTVRAEKDLAQGKKSTVGMLGKLSMSRILHESARLRTALVGAEAMLESAEYPDGDTANFLALNAFLNSIGGGTDQIQRNIIAERILGLPREADPSRGVPFSKARKASRQ